MENTFGPVISSYSRAQAIEDGVLVDVSEIARGAGIKWPVAVTARVWGLIEPTEAEQSFGQSIDGRLWDTLWMLRFAIGKSNADREIFYKVIYAAEMKTNKSRLKQVTEILKAVSGPGDNGEPVITIMLPWED